MSAPTEKTYFLSDMPEYQKTSAQLHAMSPQQLSHVAGLVDFSQEYQGYQASLQQVTPSRPLVAGAATLGAIATGALVYLGIGKFAPQWSRNVKLSLSAAIGYLGGETALSIASTSIASKHLDIAEKNLQAKEQFIDALATQLVERQVALAGQDNQIYLISTAENSPQATTENAAPTTQRYAVPTPALSHTAAQQSRPIASGPGIG